MRLYKIKSPTGKIHYVIASDKFEAIQKAKKIDLHCHKEHLYKLI
jgi:hypothetical protein